MKQLFFSIIAATLLLSAPPFALGGNRKTVLIHVTTTLTRNDARTHNVAFLALDALEQGRRAVVLFDDRGVKAVKLGAWYGGDTSPLDKTMLPEQDRNALSARLKVPLASIPENFGDFLRFLKGKGLELYVSSTALQRCGISEDKYDHAALPVDSRAMLELFEQADVYITY
jgi:hypothetical protein